MVFGILICGGAGFLISKIIGGKKDIENINKYVIIDDIDKWYEHAKIIIDCIPDYIPSVQKKYTISELKNEMYNTILRTKDIYNKTKNDYSIPEMKILLANNIEKPLKYIFSNERSDIDLLINTYFSNENMNWKIVEQTSIADNIYTGCWFDAIIINILQYYPSITKKICKLLPENYKYNPNIDKPKDYINKIRESIMNYVDIEYKKDNIHVKNIVLKISIQYMMLHNTQVLPYDYMDILFNTLIENDINIKNFDAKDLLDRNILNKFIKSTKKEFNNPEILNSDFIYDVWTTDVKPYILTTTGMEEISNNLISYLLNITIVLMEFNGNIKEYYGLITLADSLPKYAYKLYYPTIDIKKIINAPSTKEEIDNADNNTIFILGLSNRETSGHKMFITNNELRDWDYIDKCSN
jgi:hypothetical protein